MCHPWLSSRCCAPCVLGREEPVMRLSLSQHKVSGAPFTPQEDDYFLGTPSDDFLWVVLAPTCWSCRTISPHLLMSSFKICSEIWTNIQTFCCHLKIDVLALWKYELIFDIVFSGYGVKIEVDSFHCGLFSKFFPCRLTLKLCFE